MKMVYKETDRISKEVIEEIVQIEKEKGLTATNLLERAKEKDNPLHKFFDWNNNKAGEKWRMHQARLLVNEIKVIVEGKEMYAFESVIVNTETLDEEEAERTYKPVNEILDREDLRVQVIRAAINHAEYWKNQYGIYGELKPIVTSIDKTKKSLEKKWQKKKA